MQIFLDIGNTFVKIARLYNEALEDGPRVPSSDFIQNPIKYFDNYQSTDSNIYIASVFNESINSSLVDKLEGKGFICTIIEVHQEFNGFKTLYNPESLGVDRWLACLAAYRIYRQGVVVIDAGTAITIDFVTSNGLHLGGYIVSGITGLSQTIKSSTGLNFDHSTANLSDSIPTNTNDALTLGGWMMVSGFFKKIEETIARNEVFQSSSNELVWVLTGGDHEKVRNFLRPPSLLNTQLVLEGAVIVSKDLTEPHD